RNGSSQNVSLVDFYQCKRGEALYGALACGGEGCTSISEPASLRDWTKNGSGTGNLWADSGRRSNPVSGGGSDCCTGRCGSPWKPHTNSARRNRSRNPAGTTAGVRGNCRCDSRLSYN